MTETFGGACHCGAVRFRAAFAGGAGGGLAGVLAGAHRCNCSFCRMRGAVTVAVRCENFVLLEGSKVLSLYQFNTRVAEHRFCALCGIYTHHRRRSDPEWFGVNVACLDGVSPFDLARVPVSDGVNHPRDGGDDRIIGILTYTPQP